MAVFYTAIGRNYFREHDGLVLRKVSQLFDNNPQGSRLRGRQKIRWCNCVQTGIHKFKITNWKEKSKTELTGISLLRTRRSALDCIVIAEEEKEEEEEEEEGLVLVLLLCILEVPISFLDSNAVVVIIVYRDFPQ